MQFMRTMHIFFRSPEFCKTAAFKAYAFFQRLAAAAYLKPPQIFALVTAHICRQQFYTLFYAEIQALRVNFRKKAFFARYVVHFMITETTEHGGKTALNPRSSSSTL